MPVITKQAVTCPYCGDVVRQELTQSEIDSFSINPALLRCGGCDRYFAARVVTVTRYEVQTQALFDAAAPPEPPAPDWATAPEWAKWWAVDNNGAAFWFDAPPTTKKGYWFWPGSRCRRDGNARDLAGYDWRQTMHQRPPAVQP
jgi:hypothetical protein